MSDDEVKANLSVLWCCPEAVSNLPALGHAALAMIARLEARVQELTDGGNDNDFNSRAVTRAAKIEAYRECEEIVAM